MNDALNKIKTLIEQSSSFGILNDPKPEEHEYLARFALEYAILKKKSPVTALPEPPENYEKKWRDILQNKPKNELTQKSSINLPKNKYQIKEISYEEDEKYLKLILTSGGLTVSKEDIVLETVPPAAETVFCFFENSEKIKYFGHKIRMPDKDRIIFVTANDRTMTEKVFDIAEMFYPNILTDKTLATVLYAALVKETGGFSENTAKGTLSLASVLLESGADRQVISDILKKETGHFKTQMLGRIMARTFIDENTNISWSFLNQKDLQKTNHTNASPETLYEFLKKMRPLMPPQKFHVLVWQTLEGIKALIAGPADKNESYLIPLANRLQTQPQSKFFVAGPFENFTRAETQLRNAIKSASENFPRQNQL